MCILSCMLISIICVCICIYIYMGEHSPATPSAFMGLFSTPEIVLIGNRTITIAWSLPGSAGF